jgi:glutamyl-tRNA(Gln) amidotransferase subunit E
MELHGLKAGLEIHQQLDTHKLFCNCPSQLRSDSPKFTIMRKLNPVVGETGQIDTAAAHEKSKDKTFLYEVYDTNCLVELDEEPPHDINKEALKIGLQIATLMNCEIFPVTQVMRKTVIDGSNTSGFQRTALIAHDGFIETSQGKVGIETIAIEEDAARPSGKKEEDLEEVGIEASAEVIPDGKNSKIYKLDRLGIPLLEITTKPELYSPEQIKEAALKIGEILRSCKVKRGIGTIRQDVNVSTTGTERVEIKGFQDAKTMTKTVELEINRQQKLIEIHNELKKKKAKTSETILDITNILKNTECKFVKSSIDKGAKAIATKLEGFDKILGIEISESKRFGTELSEHAKMHGVGGMIHSDENLKKYNFSDQEIEEIKSVLEIKPNDAFIIIVDEENKARKAIASAINRAQAQIEKASQKEVRKSNEDGTTSFLRPMPGSARMYPETDIKLLKISHDLINEVKATLPKLISENKSYLHEFGLNDELVALILQQDKLDDFKFLSNSSKNYALIAKTLTIFPTEIAKKTNEQLEKVNKKLPLQLIESILQAVEKSQISESDVRLVMQKIFEGQKLEDAIKKEQIDLKSEIQSLIKEKPGLSANAYMGLIMQKFKGKVNGKEVMEVLKNLEIK